MKNNNYAAPEFEVVEIAVERGFEVSATSVEGPTFMQEDIEW